MRTDRRLPLSAASLAALAALAGPLPAAADTYVVDRHDDDYTDQACTPAPNDCSLRGAVFRANDHVGPDLIVFGDLGLFRIVSLQGPDLPVFGELVIDGGFGEGVAIVGSPFGGRVFYVEHSALTLKDLIVAGGQVDNDLGGGVLASDAVLTLERVEIFGNYSSSGGGGIAAYDSDVVLLRSTVAGNETSGSGGGIKSIGGEVSTLTLEQSTVSGNLAWGGNALAVIGTNLDVTYSTIADNAGNQSSHRDIELHAFGGTPSWVFRGTVVKGNCELIDGTIASGGANVESPGDSCGLSASSDQVGVLDAGLTELDYFGGATLARVHRPMVLGPAVDLPFLVVPSCGSLDQRGSPRPLDGDSDGEVRCDAGAVELHPMDVVFWDDFATGDTSRWSLSSP